MFAYMATGGMLLGDSLISVFYSKKLDITYC
jgi:hypothetical protein